MALVHHVEFVDGRVEHREFSRNDWEWAMREPEVAAHWGHPPERCFNPVLEVRGREAAPASEVESFVPRAMLIEQKHEQIRRILAEAARPAQLTLPLGDGLD